MSVLQVNERDLGMNCFYFPSRRGPTNNNGNIDSSWPAFLSLFGLQCSFQACQRQNSRRTYSRSNSSSSESDVIFLAFLPLRAFTTLAVIFQGSSSGVTIV